MQRVGTPQPGTDNEEGGTPAPASVPTLSTIYEEGETEGKKRKIDGREEGSNKKRAKAGEGA